MNLTMNLSKKYIECILNIVNISIVYTCFHLYLGINIYKYKFERIL